MIAAQPKLTRRPSQNDSSEHDSFRIPSLDGFRALSIVMVMLAHATGTASFPPRLTKILHFAINGNLGVRIFFVISGFLITTLLLKEEERKGTISLRLFYERRAVRILPVYWTYILAVALLAFIGNVRVAPRAFLEAITFSTSWFHSHQWVFEHTWSLSLEEAFYLMWPLLFKVLTPRARMGLAMAIIAAGPMLRGWLYHLHGEDYFVFYSLGVAGNIDPIMCGCLLAMLHQAFPLHLDRIARKLPVLCHGMFFVCMYTLIALNKREQYHAFITVPFTVTVSCLGICYLVYYHCYISQGIAYRILNLPIVARIGVLSYSLYLWQQCFLFPAAQHLFWWQTAPANLIFASAMASASYYLLEKPFLRLRKHLRSRSFETRTIQKPMAYVVVPEQVV